MSITIRGANRNSTINQVINGDSNHSGYQLSTDSVRNLYEIQRSNNFEFIVTDIGDLFINGLYDESELRGRNIFNSDTVISYAGADPTQVIRISATGFPVPTFSQQAIEISRGNSTIKYAGKASFSSGTLGLNDFIGAGTAEVLQAWQNKSYNPITDKVGVVGDYKKRCYLEEYTPDYQLVRRWVIEGCWISRLDLGTMNNESGGKVTLSASIEYDRAYIDTSLDYSNVTVVNE